MELRYSGVNFSEDGSGHAEGENRVLPGRRTGGSTERFVVNRKISSVEWKTPP